MAEDLIWNNDRRAELILLEDMIRNVALINSGSRCLERIASCIEKAEKLTETNVERNRRSFVDFLHGLAVETIMKENARGGTDDSRA